MDDLDKAERVGVQYSLTDPRFESIGFVPQSSIFFSYYRIPNNQKEQPSFQGTSPEQEGLFDSWIAPSLNRDSEAWQELESW